MNSAEQKVEAITAAGLRLAGATRREIFLNIGKAEKKSEAIRRLMLTENEETKKPHSASSAEKIVELDAEYREYLVCIADTVCDKIEAQAAYDAAKLCAQLAIRLVGEVAA